MTTLLIDSDIILMQAAARATTDCQWDDEVYISWDSSCTVVLP